MASGEPVGPADGVHEIRQLTAPARPQQVTERGYVGPQFRVTPLADRADRDVHDAQAAAEFGAIRHVRLSFCAYTVTLSPLSGGDAGELAESGVVRARARASARVQGVGMLRDDGDLHGVPPGWANLRHGVLPGRRKMMPDPHALQRRHVANSVPAS